MRTRRRAPRPASAGDVALAVALVVVAQVDIWAPDLAVWGDDPVPGSRPVNALLFLLVTGAVAWRRTAPLGALGTAMAALAAQAVASQDSPIGLLVAGPTLMLVYAVGCYGTRHPRGQHARRSRRRDRGHGVHAAPRGRTTFGRR